MNERRSGAGYGLLLLVATGILWGTIGPVSKQISLISDFDAVSISWLRAIIASPVCIFAAWMALGSDLFKASRRDLTMMVGYGVVLISYQWLYLAAVDQVGVTTATLVSLCGSPIIVALLSAIILHEQISARLLVSLSGAIVGVVLLIGQPEAGSRDNTIIGVLLAIACAALLAVHALGMRSLAGRVHPLQPLAIGFPVGAIVITPVALARGVSFDQPAEAWFWLAFLGLVPSSGGLPSLSEGTDIRHSLDCHDHYHARTVCGGRPGLDLLRRTSGLGWLDRWRDSDGLDLASLAKQGLSSYHSTTSG